MNLIRGLKMLEKPQSKAYQNSQLQNSGIGMVNSQTEGFDLSPSERILNSLKEINERLAYLNERFEAKFNALCVPRAVEVCDKKSQTPSFRSAFFLQAEDIVNSQNARINNLFDLIESVEL